jgi:hypothetical protein
MDDRRHDHVERSAEARAQVVRVRAERRQEVRPPEQLRDLRKAAAASMGTARQSDTQREAPRGWVPTELWTAFSKWETMHAPKSYEAYSSGPVGVGRVRTTWRDVPRTRGRYRSICASADGAPSPSAQPPPSSAKKATPKRRFQRAEPSRARVPG